MTNVVYYLGAGASVNAIPVVGNKFAVEFQAFCKAASMKRTSDKYQYGCINFINEIKTTIPYHYSPDTLARKLMYQDMNRYEAYKRLLSFYFVFKQGAIAHNLAGRFDDVLLEYFPPNRKMIDERYDVIFAALMNEETQNLPSNFKIITWNYDMQIELSYQSFFSHMNIEQILLKLGVYPRATNGKIASHTDANIIKLNGTAGLEYDGKNPDSGYFRTHHAIMNYEEFFSTVRSSVDGALGADTAKGENAYSMLQFAWDRDSFKVREYNPTYATAQHNAINRASSIIRQAKDLVVIGYSFPLYNRLIDTHVLQGITRYCSVYIQVPDRSEYEKVSERFRRLLPIEVRSDVKLIPILDPDQFFVPEGI